MRISCRAILLCLLMLTAHATRAQAADAEPKDASPAAPRTMFDPAKHMRVSEVRIGMKGYGLSVFKGTTIEPFQVEVLSILKNFNPKYDVILISCTGANLEHTGSIAGMSGSPIYLKDDAGKVRMVGAFAYGWSLQKDPIGGVQPVEYMLQLPTDLNPNPAPAAAAVSAQGDAKSTDKVESPTPRSAGRWSLSEVLTPRTDAQHPRPFGLIGHSPGLVDPRLGSDAESMQLKPLATPMMMSGLSPQLLKELGPVFSGMGIVPMQAGGSGSTTQPADANQPEIKLEPGSVLAVPLLVGDVDMTAIGTVTEVLDGNVFGFGHPFNAEGPISLPLGTGYIDGVIANLETSFKLGALSKVTGTLTTDQMVGVAGKVGAAPALVPIDVHVLYTDGSLDRTYHFDCAVHPRFTPILASIAMVQALGGNKELPTYHTIEYDLSVEFANGRKIDVNNTVVNAGQSDLYYAVGTMLQAAANNQFERVMLKKLSATVRVTPEAREAQILSVNVPRLKLRPGDNLKAYVSYRPFRSEEAILPVEMELPKDLPDGTYQLVISDAGRYFSDETTMRPFRFTAENIDEVFEVLADYASIKQNALYIRLLRQADGVAVGRTAMPHLPSSRRQVMLSSGRSDVQAFMSSAVKIVPTQVVMGGSADFVITIDKDAKVEVGGAPNAAPPAAGNGEKTPEPAGNLPDKPAAKSDKPAAPNGDEGNGGK